MNEKQPDLSPTLPEALSEFTVDEVAIAMDTVLRDMSDFDAFMLDFFPEVRKLFTESIDGVQRRDLLLARVEPSLIMRHLAEYNKTAGWYKVALKKVADRRASRLSQVE